MAETEEENFSSTPRSSLTKIVASDPGPFSFLVCTLVITIAYRVQLTAGLLTAPVRPFDLNLGSFPIWFMVAYWPYDAAVILLLSLVSWLVARAFRYVPQGTWSRGGRILGGMLLHLALLLLLIIYGAHLRLLFTVQTGLDCSAIQEGVSAASLQGIVNLMKLQDFLSLFAPVALLWLVRRLPMRAKTWLVSLSLALLCFFAVGSISANSPRTENVPGEVRLNPALFLTSDLANQALKTDLNASKRALEETPHGLTLGDPTYVKARRPFSFPPPPKDQPWNIVFVVMESVGTRYVFDTSRGHEMPMPFLHRLSREGWHLRRHYTTSNVSTKAVFSMLSGLYDLFGRRNLGTLPEANVPWICSFLGKKYDSFLVTPSSLAWYFPTALVRNNGLPEMHSFENLSLPMKEERNSLGRYVARDEIQTVDFFLRRLDQAKEPFIGLYISFVAHFPYFDYGPEYRVTDPSGGLLNRYSNNLRLLDRMIERIHDHLEDRGLLERTILVVVGDHGQAFGQHHPNNFMHYRYSYNENLEAPAILYQPALFRSRTFEFPTSHVDLLPTLLDAMGIPYNPSLLDGESLFHYPFSRRYIFSYGLEETVSCLDDRQIKVQYSLKDRRCWAFDLKTDPQEKTPLDCSPFKPQLNALQGYVSQHDARLLEYNQSLRDGQGFHGHKHPSL